MRHNFTEEKLQTPSKARTRRQEHTHTRRTHGVGALPQNHPGLCGTQVGPCRTPTAHQCPSRSKRRGWPKHAPRTTLTQKIEKTKPKSRDERPHLLRPERGICIKSTNDSGATVPSHLTTSRLSLSSASARSTSKVYGALSTRHRLCSFKSLSGECK